MAKRRKERRPDFALVREVFGYQNHQRMLAEHVKVRIQRRESTKQYAGNAPRQRFDDAVKRELAEQTNLDAPKWGKSARGILSNGQKITRQSSGRRIVLPNEFGLRGDPPLRRWQQRLMHELDD